MTARKELVVSQALAAVGLPSAVPTVSTALDRLAETAVDVVYVADEIPQDDVDRLSAATGSPVVPTPAGAEQAILTAIGVSDDGTTVTTHFDRISDGLVVVDAAWRVTYVNEPACRFFELSRAELLGADFLATFPEGSGKRFFTAYERAMAERTPVTVEGESVRYPGTWLEARAYPAAGGLFIYFRDVTQQLAAERSLRDRTSKIHALHLVASDLAAATDEEVVYQRVVEAAERILAFDICYVATVEGGDILPRAANDPVLLEADVIMSVDEGVAGRVVRTGETYVVDDAASDPYARPVSETYVSALTIPMGDLGVFQALAEAPAHFGDVDREAGELLVAHATAAIERIRREHELRRQNARLEEFAELVSHDLRNPLAVAQGFLETIEPDADDADAHERVGRALGRMESIVGDVLTLAREGRLATSREAVSLQEVATAAWEAVDTMDASLEVTTDAVVQADAPRLQRLFENCFRNAVEHGGPSVAVTVGNLADGAGFHVADDGPGIPAHLREQVFESGYTTNTAGTGFGLAIVEEICESHGWDARVSAEATDGAVIEVRLPPGEFSASAHS